VLIYKNVIVFSALLKEINYLLLTISKSHKYFEINLFFVILNMIHYLLFHIIIESLSTAAATLLIKKYYLQKIFFQIYFSLIVKII